MSADGKEAITVLNAEAAFLPTLHKIHAAFPRLRIVLEHCTSKNAVDAVRTCGPTVAATITAHHMWLIIDNVVSNVFNFCRPVAKLPAEE
jgi:dihydroorotase